VKLLTSVRLSPAENASPVLVRITGAPPAAFSSARSHSMTAAPMAFFFGKSRVMVRGSVAMRSETTARAAAQGVGAIV